MSTAHVVVLIETADGKTLYRHWRGDTIKAIHRTARKVYESMYPQARVSFGVGYYVNSYGAH